MALSRLRRHCPDFCVLLRRRGKSEEMEEGGHLAVDEE